MDYTITLSESEKLAMEFAANDPQDWIENAVKVRAKIASDEICLRLMKHCNENNISIATGIDAQITQAFELEVVVKASEITNEQTP